MAARRVFRQLGLAGRFVVGDARFLPFQTASLDAFAHQDVPLEKIVEAVDPERNMGQSPLFQVMMVLQNTREAKLGLPGLEVTR